WACRTRINELIIVAFPGRHHPSAWETRMVAVGNRCPKLEDSVRDAIVSRRLKTSASRASLRNENRCQCFFKLKPGLGEPLSCGAARHFTDFLVVTSRPQLRPVNVFGQFGKGNGRD